MIFIIALVFFIVYSVIVNLIKEMSAASIAYPKIIQLPKGFFPDYSQDLFLPAHEKLKARGCLGPLWFKIESETVPNRYFEKAYLGLYFDPKYQTMISIQPSPNVEVPNALYLACITPTEHNTWIYTTNVATSVLGKTKFEQLERVDTIDIEDLLNHHIDRLKSLISPINHSMTISEIATHILDQKTQYAILIEEKRIIDDPIQKQYSLTWKGWKPLFKAIFKPLVLIAKNQDTPTERMIELYLMQEKALSLKNIPLKLKIFFPVLSCVLFMIASYFIFGIETGAILLFVIMFHEFGHYFAMKKCSYQNVDLAAVPLLGGVTTGIPQNYNQYHQAWIAMWGPLPGIIIGASLLAIGYLLPTSYITYSLPLELAIFFLLVNYLNLLPMLPLDGGHIIMSLVPNRFIKIYRAIIITTTILGIAIVFTLDLPIFLIFLFSLPLFTMERDMSLYKIVQQIKRQPNYATMDNDALLIQAIEAVKTKFPKKNTKTHLQYIKNVYLNISEVTMTKAQRAGLLMVYLLLFTPLIGIGIYFYSSIASWQNQIQTAQHEVYEDLKSKKLLNAPMTDEEITDFESSFNVKMPEEVIEAYKMANGSKDHYFVPSNQLNYAEHNTMWVDLVQAAPPVEYEYDDTGTEIQTPISLPKQRWFPIIAHPNLMLLVNPSAKDDRVWLQCMLHPEAKNMYCYYNDSYFSTYIFMMYRSITQN